jgi:hypothetical protein
VTLKAIIYVGFIRASNTHNDRTKRAKVTEFWHFQGNRKNFSLVLTTSRTFVEMTCFRFVDLASFLLFVQNTAVFHF